MYSNEDYLLQLLVEAEVITAQEIEDFRPSVPAGESVIYKLVETAKLSENQVSQVAASAASCDFYDLNDFVPSSEVVQLIPPDGAKRYQAVPISDDGVQITVVVADPLDFEVLDSLPHLFDREIQIACAAPSAIEAIIRHSFGAMMGDSSQGIAGEGEDADAPIIRLVRGIIYDAFDMRASDIHIEPLEATIRIRYRVDGKLIEVANHPKKLLPAIIARIKVMSGSMSIAEKRIPQDGRIQLTTSDGKDVDFRVSSIPSNHGESIVMRILDKSALVLGLAELGFLSDDQATFEELVKLPDGIILVTGPTGSGKTTTLYACLNYINKPDKKIITVEDPVEYEMPGINQVMVQTDIGMTFAAALRAMLRQAPNIIMLGEIRDGETANIAINASLTGHLVLSTLHTNDAPSSVARLADIGIKRFLIASAVRAILAQRLVRALCPNCKTPMELTDKQMRALKIDSTRMDGGTILGPKGCIQCRQGGYRGRKGLFEIFTIDDQVRHMINEELTSPQLRKRARELGMRTLREDGVRKILNGMTSAEEVLAVTNSDSE